MTERIYNVLIAGCFKMTQLHAKAIQSIHNASLSGVWNRTQKTAEDFARVYIPKLKTQNSKL
jgi:hypothetical protein